MDRDTFPISAELQAFVTYLRGAQLEALARDYWQRVKAHDLPMLRLLAPRSEAQILAGNMASLDGFLGTLLDGTALEVATEGLRKWERDEIPGFSKYDFQPRDVILVGDAHAGAMIGFLDAYTDDRALALRIVRELRAFYLRSELNAYEAYSRIRDEAVARATKAEAEREAHHKELLTVNEQLNQQTLALADRNDFIENVVRHLPIGIAYLDEHHTFRWVNPVFAAFARRPAEDFTARSYYEVFPAATNPNPHMQEVLATGRTTQLVAVPYQRDGGELTYWDMVFLPVNDRGGRPEGLVVMAQDTTTRVLHEQGQQGLIDQLKEVDRLKNDFLSILSHELRTPINAIMGFASILEDEIPGPMNPDQHGHLQRILTGSEVLLGLIEDLLDMSRIQAGKFSLSLAPMAPAQVIEEAVAGLVHLAEQKGQAIATHVEAGLPMLQADAQRLRQVVTNLVGNAIKFGPERDTIAVRVTRQGAMLRCEVEDHGEGIDAADIPRLFQPFTQLDTGNTRKAGGAGLGLSIVRALVEAHGGEVGLRSEPGVRTVFWFTLPALAGTATYPT